MSQGINAVTLRDLEIDSDFDINDAKSQLNKYGACVIPNWVDSKLLTGLQKEFKQILEIKNHPDFYEFSYEIGEGRSFDPFKNDSFQNVKRIFSNDKMEQLAKLYIGNPCFVNHEVYATYDYKTNGFIAPVHFDKLWTLKYMIYLYDIRIGQGAFGIIPGSMHHARRIYRNIFEENNLLSLSMNDPLYQKMPNEHIPNALGNVIDIEAPAGTLIIFDTDTCHQGGYLEQGETRSILRGHSGPALAYSSVEKYDRQWWRAEKTLASQND